MAHRHTVQKRAYGGRNRFSAGGKANPFRDEYAGKGSPTSKEGKSEKEHFATGGGVSLAKAHGGPAKKRGDFKRGGKAPAFKKGGSVWSHASEGLRGEKGFAGPHLSKENNEHGEKHDTTANRGHARTGRGGKEEHQYAKGGKVKAKGLKHGGHVHEEADEEGEDEDDGTAARGGHFQFKKDKMHPAHVHKGKKAEGGRTDGHWMEKAFANSHGQFKSKAHKAGMSTEGYANKEASSPHASTKTKRQANLAKLGAKYGGG